MADKIKLAELDMDFRNRVKEHAGGEHLLACFQCGTCTAGCPVREVEDSYNPRRIARMAILGMKDELLKSKTIWLCSVCYTCYERCPQNVHLTEVMTALKNIAVEEGCIFPAVQTQLEMLAKFGRIYEIEDFDNKKRKRMGLPEIKQDASAFRKILELMGLDHLIKDRKQSE
jgi:heterodisulfide reductase subunit C